VSNVVRREIRTQQRVIVCFQEALGYAYVSRWKDRAVNPVARDAS